MTFSNCRFPQTNRNIICSKAKVFRGGWTDIIDALEGPFYVLDGDFPKNDVREVFPCGKLSGHLPLQNRVRCYCGAPCPDQISVRPFIQTRDNQDTIIFPMILCRISQNPNEDLRNSLHGREIWRWVPQARAPAPTLLGHEP